MPAGLRSAGLKNSRKKSDGYLNFKGVSNMKKLSVSKKVLVVVTGVLAVSGTAFAALPASVGTTVTAIQTDGQAVFDLVFPVVGVFIGLAIVIKLFKRFANKV